MIPVHYGRLNDLAESKPNNVILTSAWCLVLLVAIALRMALIRSDPFVQGDWHLYSMVANNILRGCGVAVTVAGGACLPHFGGNGLPGYPAFVALSDYLFGQDSEMLLVMPALAQCLAILMLGQAAGRYFQSRWLGLLLALILAVSPPVVSFARWRSTEALAIAATMWLFAELILSLAIGRLRIFATGVALAVAMFIRLDSVALVVPVAVTAFLIHPLRLAIARGALVASVLALPVGGWLVRNAVVGLPSVWPTVCSLPDGTSCTLGFRKWVMTWAVTEEQRDNTFNRVSAGRYRDVRQDIIAAAGAWNSEIAELLATLREHQAERPLDGLRFPPELNQRFDAIADKIIARDPWDWWVTKPALGAFHLWWQFSLPWSSFTGGKPIDEEFQTMVVERGFAGLLTFAARHPSLTAMRLTISVYRTALVGSFLLLLLASAALRRNNPVLLVTASFLLARTALLAATFSLEQRYMVEMVPALELGVFFGLLGCVRPLYAFPGARLLPR